MLSTIFFMCLALLAANTQAQESTKTRVILEFRLAEISPSEGLQEVTIEDTNEKLYLHKEVIINNKDVAAARAIPSFTPRSFDIEIEFSEEGADRISRVSAENIGKHIAILMDGKVIVAPILRSAISHKAVITGRAPSFTKEEAEELARKIVAQ
jgi:preprotein translocase subunit SecD